MPFQDISIITPVIAKRNGLPFFELLITDWGDLFQANPAGNVNDAVTKLLPPGVTLAGVAIGPLSTVSEVLLAPDYNSYVGINGINPQLSTYGVVDTSGTTLIGQGAQTFAGVTCSVERPFVGTLPGPVVVRAAASTLYEADPNNETAIRENSFETLSWFVNANLAATRLPVLQLYCWLKDPGPVGYPTKRAPLFDVIRIDGDDLPASLGNPNTRMKVYPIGGRKRVHIDLWALPPGGATTGGTIEYRVVLLRPVNRKLTVDVGPYNRFGQLFEHQVWPPASTGGAQTPIGARLTEGDDETNHAHIEIDDPQALFVGIYGALVAGGANSVEALISFRAED